MTAILKFGFQIVTWRIPLKIFPTHIDIAYKYFHKNFILLQIMLWGIGNFLIIAVYFDTGVGQIICSSKDTS